MLLMTYHLLRLHGGALRLDGYETETASDISQPGESPESMHASETTPTPPKISAEFAARLQRLAPDEPIRVIVLAQGVAPFVPGGERLSQRGETTRAQRRALNAAARRAVTEEALGAVDAVLADGKGRRLTEQPNVLGHIVVETTRTGVEALCRLPCVQTVLEDQSIHPHLPVARPE